MINVQLSFAPFITGIIAFIVWDINSDSPIPLWIVILTGVGALLFFVVSFLAFHRVRMERDKLIRNVIPNEHAVLAIVDAKIPQVFQITDTLQKMAEFHNIVLNKLLARKVKVNKLASMQKELRKRHDINIQFKDSKIGDTVKINIIHKQMKELKLYNKDFKEELIPFILEVTWVLDDKGVGIPDYLEDVNYTSLKSLLNTQTQNIASEDLEQLILTFEDLCLGFNSLIAYMGYFPKEYKDKWIPKAIDKPVKQLKYERNQMLQKLIQIISKEIERELRNVS